MPPFKAGQEIDAYCTKCKMDLLHRVVAVAGGKPVKVECRTCMTTHVYRAPRNVRSPGASPAAGSSVASSPRVSSSEPSARRARTTAPSEPVALVPPQGAHVHLYKVTERFAPEAWVSHKTFGIGRVVREIPPDKIEVRFDDGPKVLVHGKTP
jgi:hypothetical protein